MTTAADIAPIVGLKDPESYYNETGKGRTTMMLLNVVAAAADGWTCRISGERWADVEKLTRDAIILAGRAGVRLEIGQIAALPIGTARQMEERGHFEPERRNALFMDHFQPDQKTPTSWQPQKRPALVETRETVPADNTNT